MNIRGKDTIPLVDKKNSNTNTNSMACHKTRMLLSQEKIFRALKVKHIG
jgi:hypothetical protein